MMCILSPHSSTAEARVRPAIMCLYIIPVLSRDDVWFHSGTSLVCYSIYRRVCIDFVGAVFLRNDCGAIQPCWLALPVRTWLFELGHLCAKGRVPMMAHLRTRLSGLLVRACLAVVAVWCRVCCLVRFCFCSLIAPDPAALHSILHGACTAHCVMLGSSLDDHLAAVIAAPPV